MKSHAAEPKSDPKPQLKAQPEDQAARVKRLTELLRTRLRQELAQTGGSGALEFWLRSE
jgi:hypothetical protein